MFYSSAAKTKTSYFVFIPRPYHNMKNRRCPVIYWLHGTGNGRIGVTPLSKFFAKAMRNKDMPLALVVFPNGLGNSMWVDSKDGSIPMETLLMTELIPHVDSTYRTIADRNGRIIEGWSMGGYGAPRLAMTYPDVFCAVSILAGGPLQPDFHVCPARGGVKPSKR
ncbi:MAG: alpha/beta hydrolase-fold protein [Planctomycetota bacterium]|nr:alpha/beta hydrolase-fold protein [Planctomycetota bacterium]